MKLAIVTATLDRDRAARCTESWWDAVAPTGSWPLPTLYVVYQAAGATRGWQGPHAGGRLHIYWTREILGVVPAFALGVDRALADGAEIIACLHDDLEITEPAWDAQVLDWFDGHPTCGLVGFGGARGLADDNIYQVPYAPMQLARKDFVSNMRDAEAHGRRATTGSNWRWPHEPEQVACLDGFSQIGRREYWLAGTPHTPTLNDFVVMDALLDERPVNLFQQMASWGLIHHAYDAALGCFAKRLEWEVWMLPAACHHYGGLTAVADPRYHEWANHHAQQTDRLEGIEEEGSGDQVFWLRSHKIVYDQFRDVLPIRV